MKVAGFILAIFVTVALSFYGLDLKQLGKDIEATRLESQKLALDIKQAKTDLARETTEIQEGVKSAAATDASETSTSIHKYLKESEESKNYIGVPF